MQDSTYRCIKCGSNKFFREVIETYRYFVDGNNLQMTVEDDWSHDLSLGAIICESCGFDNSKIFENVNFENL